MIQEYMDRSMGAGLFATSKVTAAATRKLAAKASSASDGKKPLPIPDFVTHSRSSWEEEEKQLAIDGHAPLLLKTGKAANPKPEEVALPQWIGANARIQAELLCRGHLASQVQCLKYCSHLADLAQAPGRQSCSTITLPQATSYG